MSKYDNEQLLGLWLDDELDETQRQEFEQRCIDEPLFSQQVEVANMLRLRADNYKTQDVPRWDKEQTFVMPQTKRSWDWLPGVSFATSLLAIVIVLTGTQMQFKDGEVRLSFGNQQAEQTLTQILDSRLDEFKQNQQAALTLYAQSLQQQQLDTSNQLTSYLLTSSRTERREDFAELIKFVNEQRSDDQLFYARQLNKLQQNIYRDANGVAIDSINP